MNRTRLFLALAVTALLSGCGPQPRARIPSSGITGASGGGEQFLHNAPAGTGSCPTPISCGN